MSFATFVASGRHYYANRASGETSWEPPLPPPPPPRFSVPPPPPSQPPMVPLNQGAMLHQNPVHSQQHQQSQQFNPAFPPPILQIPQNTQIPVGHPTHFPPPQPMLTGQANIIQPEQIQTTGKVGYQFDSSTATTPGLLVPSVRSMMNAEISKNPLPRLELEGLTAGAVADLCNVTTEFRARTTNIDKGDFADDGETQPASSDDMNQYYMPLEPFALPVASRAPHIEAGRVDIRLHALYSKLNRI